MNAAARRAECTVIFEMLYDRAPQQITVFATSVLDAASQALEQAHRIPRFYARDTKSPIVVRQGDREFQVDTIRLSRWRHEQAMDEARLRALTSGKTQ